MIEQPPEASAWLGPFDDIFLGLDHTAVIRRVTGMSPALLNIRPDELAGTSWEDFVQQHAAEPARAALLLIWPAVVEKHVDAAYWPPCWPFRPGAVVKVAPVLSDPAVRLAVHLAPSSLAALHHLIGDHALDVMARLTRLVRHVYGGVDGPLTDLQVRHLGGMLGSAESALQMLEDLHALMLLPTVIGPLPRTLSDLLQFDPRDFVDRRLITHRLQIVYDLPLDEQVYCYGNLRQAVFHTLTALIAGVTAESVIRLAAVSQPTMPVIQVTIDFASHDPELAVAARVDPVGLEKQKQQAPLRTLVRLLSSLQACVMPVGGQVWAESGSESGQARIVLMLPRWQKLVQTGD